MALYIFPSVTLYEIVFPIPVVMAFLIRPFARTNYLYSSFVTSLWNNLPDSVKLLSLYIFKAHIPH